VRSEKTEKMPPASGMVLRLGSEFASGVAVGAIAGILLDRWWGSTPFMLLICLGFGTAAGVKTMWESLKRYERQARELEEADKTSFTH
jgi:ATP synthase protein I